MTKCIKLFCALLLLSSLADATEIVVPAAQIEQGKGSLSVSYSQITQNLSLQVNNREEIRVAGNSYFSQVNNDLETKAKNSSVTAQLMVNPWSGFYYWLRLGTGDCEVAIPSTTVTNHIESRSNGLRAGFGARKLLFPDTILTPAVAVETSLMYGWYPLESFRSDDGTAVTIENTLDSIELQAAMLISKKFSRVEPYGGIKIFRNYLLLKDKASLGQISGVKDNASVFSGVKMYVFPHEALVVEGSVLGETGITIAWNVAF